MQFIPENLGLVWQKSTDACYNEVPAIYPDFLGDDQKSRIERIRQARQLYAGRHRNYFLECGRTQFDFAAMRVGFWTRVPYITCNVLKLICNKTADLLFGAEAKINAEVPAQQDAINALVDRASIDRLFYNACVAVSYEADGFVEAFIGGDGQVYLGSIPADEMFPVGEMGPDLQYKQYDRYQVKNVGSADKPVWLMMVISYKIGRIERSCWQLDSKGRKLKQLAMEEWVKPLGQPLPPGAVVPAPLTTTGIDRNTITYCFNELCEGKPISRIDGLIDLQDALNAKETQLDRVLALHADPKMWFHRSAADNQGNVRASQSAFFGDDKLQDMPAYITWDAQLEAASKSKQEVLSLMLIMAEISPSLLGLQEGAAPEAARKLRLEATNTLALVARLAANWKPVVRRCVEVAQQLEQTIAGVRYDRQPIAVKMRDGIPIDTLEQAQEISLMRACKSMSQRRSIEIQVDDPAAVEKEMEELSEETASATPSILLGNGNAENEPATDPGEKPNDESGVAA